MLTTLENLEVSKNLLILENSGKFSGNLMVTVIVQHLLFVNIFEGNLAGIFI